MRSFYKSQNYKDSKLKSDKGLKAARFLRLITTMTGTSLAGLYFSLRVV